jgi:hypothetical protein
MGYVAYDVHNIGRWITNLYMKWARQEIVNAGAYISGFITSDHIVAIYLPVKRRVN